LRGATVLAACIASTLSLTVNAVEVERSAGARLTPSGFQFASELASDLHIEIPPMPVTLPPEDVTGCEYVLDIYGYTGEVQFGEVELTSASGPPGHVRASGTVEGVEIRDVIIEATTDDWYCPEYNEDDHDVIVSLVRITDATFDLRMGAEVVDGELQIGLLDSSTIDLGTTEIQTSPWYLPESLIELAMDWFEDDIEATITATMTEAVQALLFDLPLGGATTYFSYEAGIVELDLASTGMDLVVDSTSSYSGPPGHCSCEALTSQFGMGQPPELEGNAGDVQLAFTTPAANASLGLMWSAGMLCKDVEYLDLSPLAPLFPKLEGNQGNLDFAWEITALPVVDITDDAIHATVPEMAVGLRVADTGEMLLYAELAMDGSVVPSLDSEMSAIAVTLLDLELEVLTLEAAGLIEGTTYDLDALVELIEADVVPLIAELVVDFPVAPLQYGVTGLAATSLDVLPDAMGGTVVGLEIEDGSLVAALDAITYVDRFPPEVHITTDLRQPRADNRWTVEYEGSDDNHEPLLFSWSVDNSPWTPWSMDTVAAFTVIDEGDHAFQVRARDSWWNLSETATAVFVVSSDAAEGDDDCSCTLQHGGRTSAGAVLLLAAVAGARRRPGRRR